MDDVYFLVRTDGEGNLVTARNIFDEEDPEIKGLSDVLVSRFDPNSNLLEREYFGGSSWDFPRALTLTEDGSIYFLANSESTDFDIPENFGGQFIWLAKLTEEGPTAVKDYNSELVLSDYPNPLIDVLHIWTEEPLNIRM